MLIKKKARIMSGTNVWGRLIYGDEISAKWGEGVAHVKIWRKVFQVERSATANVPK